MRTFFSLFYTSGTSNIDAATLFRYFLFQKVFGFNRDVPWPVHVSSFVSNWRKITIGNMVIPGCSPGCYIQAANGIKFGSNIWIGPNVAIISANHDENDYDKHVETKAIEIGSNVWIGANSVILPAVTIGSNVIVGAGSVVTNNLPDNCVAVGNPCQVLRPKAPYTGKQY